MELQVREIFKSGRFRQVLATNTYHWRPLAGPNFRS
jgi:hypothetical protein